MLTDARKRATAKWNKENLITLSCKVKKDLAVEFRGYCKEQNTTANAVLQAYVKKVVESGGKL